jgi:hypothetical protein
MKDSNGTQDKWTNQEHKNDILDVIETGRKKKMYDLVFSGGLALVHVTRFTHHTKIFTLLANRGSGATGVAETLQLKLAE